VRNGSVALLPTVEEGVALVFRRFDDTGFDEVQTVHFRISDTTQAPWTLDRLVVPVRAQGIALVIYGGAP
jgi:hypothetical protein